MSQDNVAKTQELFGHFGAGNIPGILEMLNDDIVIDFYGPSTIPYAGHYEGKEQARKFFETVLASVNINQFDQDSFVAQDDKVVVFGHLNLTAKKTGGSIASDYVHFITMKDGKWSHFRDFMNTYVGHEAFTKK